MSTGFCSVCGAVLRNGVCPNGHPQRAAQRSRTRGRRRWPWLTLVLFILVAVGAYGALRWYPMRAAGDLMRPSSREFEVALVAYRQAVEAVPDGGDAQAVVDGAQEVIRRTDAARTRLSAAQIALEERTPPSFPVISSRPPLDEATAVRERMLRFYTAALEGVADLESVAGYLTEVAGTLAQLEDVEATLRDASPAEVAGAVESAIPVASQLEADLEALTPPDDVGSVHASLQALADQIRADLEQVGETGREAAEPVLRALVRGIAAEIDTFRETIAGAPDAAFSSALGKELRRVEGIVRRITRDLGELEDAGVSGLTIPNASL
jgi:hypothetical protein